jgi:hypothetical protein
MPRGRGAYERRNARTVWLVYTRAGTYRRITFGGQVPALAADELVYRVRLPPIRLESRQIVTVHAERVA